MWSSFSSNVSPFRNDDMLGGPAARKGILSRGRPVGKQYPSLPRLPQAAIEAAAEAAAANQSEGRFACDSAPSLANIHRPLLSLYSTVAKHNPKTSKGDASADDSDDDLSDEHLNENLSSRFRLASLLVEGNNSPAQVGNEFAGGMPVLERKLGEIEDTQQDLILSTSLSSDDSNLFADDMLESKILTVFVIECKGLVAADATGKSDPFVHIKFGNRKQETKYVEDDNNPIFDHQFVFSTSGRNSASDRFTLKVLDHDDFGSPELLGTVTVCLNTFSKYAKVNKGSHLHRGDERSWVSGWYNLDLPAEYDGMHGGSQIYIKWTIEPEIKKKANSKFSEEHVPAESTRFSTVEDSSSTSIPTPISSPIHTIKPSVECDRSAPLDLDWVYSVLKLHRKMPNVNANDQFKTADQFVQQMQCQNIPKETLPSNAILSHLASSRGLARSPLFATMFAAECRLCSSSLCNIYKNNILPLHDLNKICKAGGQNAFSLLFMPYMLNRLHYHTAIPEVAGAIPRLLGLLCMLPFGILMKESTLCACIMGTMGKWDTKSRVESPEKTQRKLWWAQVLAACHGVLRSESIRSSDASNHDQKKAYKNQSSSKRSSIKIGISHVEIWHALRHFYMPLVRKTSGLEVNLKHGEEASAVAALTSPCYVQRSESNRHKKSTAVYINVLRGAEPKAYAFTDTIPPMWYVHLSNAFFKPPKSITDASKASKNVADFIQILSLANAANSQLQSSTLGTAEDVRKSSLSVLNESLYMLSQLRNRMAKQIHNIRLMRVTVVKAENLPIMDSVLRSSDPYVCLHFGSKKILETPVKARTLKPLYNHKCWYT